MKCAIVYSYGNLAGIFRSILIDTIIEFSDAATHQPMPIAFVLRALARR